jgi:hypothetical protein
MSDPAFQSLLEQISKAQAEGKPTSELMQMAVRFLESQPADYDNGRRDQLLAQLKLLTANAPLIDALMGNAKSGDEQAGMKNLLTLYGRLQDAQPEEEKQSRRQKFMEVMAKANAAHEKRQTAHQKKRLAQGLSEQAETGSPEAEVLIHGISIDDYLDAVLSETPDLDPVQLMNAAQARREADLRLGQTRFGGLPDLPPGQAWPTFKGKKIPFLAQLNLSEFPAEVHKLLPKDGHLFAFGLISNEKKHWPPPVSVFLYRGSADSLVRAAAPKDDEIWPDWTDTRIYEVLPGLLNPPGRDPKERSDESGETLGWFFGEMDEVFGTPGEVADERMQDGDDWINLLAIMSEGSMEWSDAGHLYLLIRRSALAKLDFSNVLAVCCSS